MSFDAGSITASLDVDKTPFQQGLDQAKADAREFADATYQAKLGVDTEQGDTDRDEFKQKLDEIGQLTETAKLHVDAGTSTETVSTLKTDLDEIGAKSVTAKVKVDMGDDEAKVEAFKLSLDSIDNKTVKIKTDTSDLGTAAKDASVLAGDLGTLAESAVQAETGLTDVGTAASGAASGGSEGTGGGLAGLSSIAEGLPSFLGPAAIGMGALATAIIPIGALAIGAGVGLAGMATAAGAAVGAFGLATLPVFTQVSTALQQISTDQAAVNRATSQAQTNTAVTHLNDDLKNLSPTVATITTGILDFKQTFLNWDAQFDPDILNVFNAALGAAGPVLNAITPLVHAGAAAMTVFFTAIGNVANSPAFTTFINFLAAQAGPAILTLTSAFITFGGTFATILEQSGPLITDVEHGLLGIVNALAHWVADGGFEGFVKWFQINGPSIVRDLLEIVSGAGKMIQALEPFGKFTLDLITAVAWLAQAKGLLSSFTNDVLNPMKNFFENSLPHAASVFSGAMTTAFQDVHNIVNTVWHSIDNDFVQPLTNFFENTIPHTVDDFVGFFTAIPGRINHVWSDVVNALHDAWSAVANWVSSTVVDPVVNFFEALPGRVSHVWSDVVTAIEGAWNVVSGWVNDNVIQPVVHFFEGIPGFISHVWSDVVSALEGAWNAISGWVDSNVIQPVVHFFESIPSGISHVWSDVVSGLEGAWNAITGWVHDNVTEPVINFFKEMPDNIAKALSALAGIIEQPFKDALGPIEAVVNTVEGWLGDIGIHIGNNKAAAQDLASTISAIPNAPDAPAPHGKASGGPVFAGTPYIVGEMGQELFVPSVSGTIIPNSAFSGDLGGSLLHGVDSTASNTFSGRSSSGQVVYAPTYNLEVAGSIDSQTIAELKSMLDQHGAEMVDALATELTPIRTQ